jgi:hypothetical protein
VRLVDGGSDVILVGSGPDLVRMRRGARRTLGRLARSGRFRTDEVDGLEHSLLGPEDRGRISALLFEHVRERFGAGRPTGRAGRGKRRGASAAGAGRLPGSRTEDGVAVSAGTASPRSV